MKVNISDFVIVIVIGIGLLFLDRVYRIEQFKVENFQNPVPCGLEKLGYPSQCPEGTKCFNGFCSSTNVPSLKPNGLPVFP